jgi:hypothetical protein
MSGNRDVVGFLKEGGAEGGGDVEAAMCSGVKEAILEDEVGARALADGAEDALIDGVAGGFLADGVQEGGGDGRWGADGVEEGDDGGGCGEGVEVEAGPGGVRVAGEGVGG